MSKVVKKVGRAISKVVKGVTNVVKKVASSPIGKVVTAAAAVYFGGAALAGAVGGASAGSGVLGTVAGAVKGAAAGISNAWAGVTGAAGALAGGQGLSAAGSSLSGGLTGAYSAGGSAVAGGVVGAAPGMTQAQMLASQNAGISGATEMTNAAAATAFPSSTGVANTALQLAPAAAKSGGLINGIMSSPYTAPALISGGTQLIGGVMQGIGAREEQKRQEDLDAAARNRYNINMGTRLWS